jgi:4-hydroxy-2-oxoheptanedioate aldolase
MSDQRATFVATANGFKSALSGDRALIGLWVATADPYVASIAGGADFDWLVIDGEHGPNDVRSILAQLMALQASASAIVVRPPIGETWMIKQLLDIGAQTLLVPMVNTREQAEALVRAVRYPPHGERGMGAAIARASNFNRIGDYAARANDNICLLVQAETRTAIANLAEIAAVEGVDGQIGSEEVQQVIEDGIRTIIKAGKPAGILTFNAALNKRYIELGAKFVAVGADITEYSAALDALAATYGLGGGKQPAKAGY